MRDGADAGGKPLFAFIDCVRGYAVLLVITCHAGSVIPALPSPVVALTQPGWHGVQLFFLASAVTLLMSWHHERERYGEANVQAFFVRRFLRIAPAYYLAALFYYMFYSPTDVSFDSLWTTLAFVHVWHPDTMGVIPASWVVVPGGWSIGVEFTFYFLFPLLAAWVNTPRRALVWLGVSVAIALLANSLGRALWTGHYPQMAIENFLYFWPPNEMPVFAIGMALYFLVVDVMTKDGFGLRAVLARRGTLVASLAALGFLGSGQMSLSLSLTPFVPLPPHFIVASLAFSLFILALAASPGTLFVNPLAQAMGKVSFSAYLVHFAVLHLPGSFPNFFHTAATGYAAIGAFVVSLVAIVSVTFAVSWCTYHAVEQPMMRLARKLTRRQTLPVLATP